MKCTIPEISWHNRDPVLSVDVQCGKEDDFYRLASGGTDSHVVVWHVRVKDNGMAEVNFVADLQRHQRAVNTVRFSPSGELLASGDDESAIIVWKQKTEQDAPEPPLGTVETNTEQWVPFKILRGHVEDVYDLCWSPDSSCLVSGSVDNTAILWDVHKGRHTAILSDHKGFVQGVAWDPKNHYVATLSSDRTCRVFNVQTRKVVCRASKAPLPMADGHDSELEGKPLRLFYDDTLKSFFRRLAFSPDGELLFAPSGIIESPDTNKHGNATHVFVRRVFNRPVMYLPSPDQYTIAVRCCPTLFQLHDGESMFALPYRIVVAIATQSSVVLYDTQQPEPFGIISNIHYTRLTDLAWSSDGRMLVVASTDGYCSIVTFSNGELGEEYVPVKTTAVPTTAVDKQDEECTNSGVETAPVVPASEEAGATDRKPEARSSEHNKDNVQESAVGANSAKKKLIRRIQPIQLTGKSSPRKPKDGIPCNSSLLKASPSQSISAYFNKTKSNEEDKDKISPRESTEVKQDSQHKSEVMDVDGDVSVVETNVGSEISSRLVPQVSEEVDLVTDKVTCQKSQMEIVSLPIRGETTVPKQGDSVPRRESSVEVPLETPAVADSHTLGISKSVDEVSEQKNQCAVSETVKLVKDECEGVEKMDVDEVVEAVSGTSNVLPDKVEVVDESHDKAEVMKESPDKAEVMKESPDKAEVMKESLDRAEVMKESPDKAEVMKESPDKAEVMKESPDKAEATKESPDKAEATKESLDRAEVTKESPDRAEVTKESPDRAEVTKESPDRAEVMKESPFKVEVTKELPDKAEVTKESLDRAEVMKESPDKAEVMKESPDRAEVTKELPDKAEVTKESPDRAEVMKESPDRAEVMKESPDKAEVMKESPDRAEVTKESLDKVEVTKESLDKVEVTKESLDKAEVMKESPDRAEVTKESPDRAEVTHESPCCKTIEKSPQHQNMLQDSKELKVVEVPEDNKALECSVNSSEQNLCCTTDSIPPTANSPSEHVHKTPRKSTATGSKPSSGTETTPGSPVGQNIGTATISPAPQAKKTPRRVQLITLSSPKSKRNLLQS